MNNALNNALNVFPTTQTPQQTQTKLQRLVYDATSNARAPTEIQSTLAYSLYDDALEYMNTLEMNRAASYTFGYHNSYGQNGTTVNTLGGNTHGESIANEMWELLIDWTLSKYTQHSVLAITKTIHLIQHVLLTGSEACVMDGELLYRIEMAVEPLRRLNTALVEQQIVESILNDEGRASGENDVVLSTDGIQHQLNKFGTRATATILKLKGGSVDKGYPVRTAANNLYVYVNNPNNLRQLRMKQQQQLQSNGEGTSLVPIGSTKQVGYITDDARYRLLQQKMAQEEKALKQKQYMEQQRLKQTRSNLAGSSAIDSFGGGYAGSNSNVVVGAAHSLEDMINSAKYELEQHKSKRQQKIANLKQGYSDDPYTRSKQLEHLERNNIESDPEFIKKEKALQDALEYLQEMQRDEQERVGDLLEGDLLGDTSASGGDGISSSHGMVGNSGGDGAADLLGFDNGTTAASAGPQFDVFGGAIITTAPPSMPAGGSTDLLGFDGLAGMNSPAVNPPSGAFSTHPNMPANSNDNTSAVMGGGGSMSNNSSFDLRPSLVTGNASSNPIDVMGPISSQQPELDEEAEAEKSRKMNMAAGLFAGMPSMSSSNATAETVQRTPIMQSKNSSNISALDDLIPVSDTPLAPPPPPGATNDTLEYNSAVDITSSSATTIEIPDFGMGPMGGSSSAGLGVPATTSDPFGMGPMGGIPSTTNTVPVPPPMAPPPPPLEAPPPLPSVPPPMAPPDNASNNFLGNNPSVEQMQEMIKQQQAQMKQMMQMMAQMQGPNNNSNGATGGWPPS